MAEEPTREPDAPESDEHVAPEGDQPIAHDAETALESVEEAASAVETAAGDEVSADGPMTLTDFDAASEAADAAPTGIKLLGDVDLRVTVELGRTRMYVEDVLRLNTDSVIELDKAAGDPVDIFVNDRHVARGEVLVLNENFCVRVSEIIAAGASED